MTINHSGAKLFGRTATEYGYIATKWISMWGLPILPVASYEITSEVKSFPQSQYKMRLLDDMEWPQIIRTGMTGYGILFAIEIVVIALMNIVICRAL